MTTVYVLELAKTDKYDEGVVTTSAAVVFEDRRECLEEVDKRNGEGSGYDEEGNEVMWILTELSYIKTGEKYD